MAGECHPDACSTPPHLVHTKTTNNTILFELNPAICHAPALHTPTATCCRRPPSPTAACHRRRRGAALRLLCYRAGQAFRGADRISMGKHVDGFVKKDGEWRFATRRVLHTWTAAGGYEAAPTTQQPST